MDFILSPEGLLDPKVAAVLAMGLTQWLKQYLRDWRYTQLLVLGMTLGVEFLATAILGQWDFFGAALAAFWGASLATFGYEAVSNWLGMIGVGQRAQR